MRRIIVLLLISASVAVHGQKVTVSGQFLVDSIRIGEPFPYALTAAYPWEKTILFPDSSYDFKPFEYVDKKYFPTKTVDGISRDSVIYYLNSFEIDSAQWLTLPVYVVQPNDCTSVWTEEHVVWLQHQVTLNTDSIQAASLPLKVDAYYIPVHWLFNYPLASIIGVSILVILIAVWIIFGKRVRKFFKARNMRRSFEKYLLNFTDAVEGMKQNYSIVQAENAISLWKKYLESLEDKPFTKYTSKEILQVIENKDLAGPLKTVDRLLYAGAPPASFDAFYALKSYSEDCFYKKIQEINSPGK